jgi:two-component system, cell cycle sensor histidine kinase and response regulator CckA
MPERTWSSTLYPKGTGDVGRDRNARTLQFACFLFVVTIGMIAALDTITRETAELPMLVTVVAGLLAAAVMNRAGKSTWAARIAILSIMLTAILLVVDARDGFRSHAMLVFPALLLISVMFLDRASYLATAGIVLVAVVSLGIAERYGLTRAVPGVRSPTSYESIFTVDLILLVYAAVGYRIALDTQRNVVDLRAGIERLSAANLELKKAAEELQRRENIFTALGAALDYGLWMCAPDGRNIYNSASLLKMVGKDQKDIADFKWADLVHPDDRERMITAWRECVRSGRRWQIEYRFRGAHGEWHPTLSQAVPVYDEQGQITCWAGMNLDTTALKRTQESLRASERQARVRAAELQAVMDAAPAAIFVAHDSDCRHMSGNRTAQVLLRQQAGTNFSMSAPVGERPTNLRFMRNGAEIQPYEMPVERTARTGQPVRNWEVQVVFEDSTSIDLLGNVEPMLDDSGRPHGAVAVLSDITERKRAEAEREKLSARLAQAQKLESLGRLAGGVAHDFNNLMSVIHLNAESALEGLKSGDPAVEPVTGIRDAAERATELGQQLMAFSSKQPLQNEILNLNSVIANTEKLLRRLIEENVTIEFKPGSGLGPVKADRGQIGQIIMNLAINSRDAMPEGGTFTIETAAVELDESSALLSPDAKPGSYVMLVVRDTGTGMDLETQTRIFEPFFTTKNPGKGTGLGLSVVYGAVKQSGGFITVASEPEHGTEFRIYLPAVAETSESIAETDKGPIQGGSETILLVEDEPALRDKIHELLNSAGYQVLAAPDGEQAYRLALGETRPIHMLLTDMVMPNMSGSRLSERMRNLRPEISVLYMSGYPDTGDAGLNPRSLTNFIQKPFTKERLLRRLREVLDGNNIAEVAT